MVPLVSCLLIKQINYNFITSIIIYKHVKFKLAIFACLGIFDKKRKAMKKMRKKSIKSDEKS